MSLPDSMLRAIAEAVERAGGDFQDAHDLADVWERLDADLDRRTARMRYEARNPACRCPRVDELTADGRCERCQGYPRSGPGGDDMT